MNKKIKNNKKHFVINALITDTEGLEYEFKISNNDGFSSSIFDFGEYHKGGKNLWKDDFRMIENITLRSKTIKSIYEEYNLKDWNLNMLVLDIQGAELLAIKGSGDLINNFKYIWIEVSTVEIYKMGAKWDEIKKYLNSYGFFENREPLNCEDILFYKKKGFNKKMIQKILNKIESRRNSKKIHHRIAVFSKDVAWFIYSTLKAAVYFISKKVDWNCDNSSLINEINLYRKYVLNVPLPSEPFILRGTSYGGFFWHFMGVLGYYDFCEKNSFESNIQFDSGSYLDKNKGLNWYKYYFDEKKINQEEKTRLKIKDDIYQDNNNLSSYAKNFLTLRQKNALFNKYIKIQRYILEEVENLIKTEFKGYYVIGCHIRGTDKYTETGFHNSPNKFFNKIDKMTKNKKKYKIFLATDDNNYYLDFQKKYGNRLISLNHKRSSESPVHLGSKFNGYEIGKQVLLDALILSKCDYFIGSRSCVSHSVLIFNPDINFKIIKK